MGARHPQPRPPAMDVAAEMHQDATEFRILVSSYASMLRFLEVTDASHFVVVNRNSSTALSLAAGWELAIRTQGPQAHGGHIFQALGWHSDSDHDDNRDFVSEAVHGADYVARDVNEDD